MLLKIYQAGQPRLRQKAKDVTGARLKQQSTQELIDLMIKTLRDAPGVGLAAPQVGEALKIIVIEDQAKYHDVIPPAILKAQARHKVPLTVLVNPRLTITDKTDELWFEGCLSIDGYVAAVNRARAVKVEALDRHGRPVTVNANGWQARILQHELDHLNGVLYIDKMKQSSFMNLKNFNVLWRQALQAKIRRS